MTRISLAGKMPLRGVNRWPDLPGWRAMAVGYYQACERLLVDIHRGFALDLGLAEAFFADKLVRSASASCGCCITRGGAGDAAEGALGLRGRIRITAI